MIGHPPSLSTLDHPRYLIFDSYDGAGTISDEPYQKVSFFGLSIVFNVLIFMKILILISLDTYSYQSKQIRTPSSLSGVIVACPSRSNSSLPSILADTLPLGKHFFPFGFLISYAYDASIGVVLSLTSLLFNQRQQLLCCSEVLCIIQST